MVFFRLHFVANDFALREQGVSRVNDAGVVAGEAACVEKRKSARKFADIRSTGPAAANGDNFGRRQRVSLRRQWSELPPRSQSHVLASGAESGGARRISAARIGTFFESRRAAKRETIDLCHWRGHSIHLCARQVPA